MPNLKAMRKSVTRFGGLTFPVDMYTNMYGSLVISAFILSEKKPDADFIKRQWRRAKRNKRIIPWTLADADFMQKVLDFFGVEIPSPFPVALVRGEHNALFAPYVDGELLPLREDGIAGVTLRTGKIYPVDFGGIDDGGDAA